jgi:hypothetical protein
MNSAKARLSPLEERVRTEVLLALKRMEQERAALGSPIYSHTTPERFHFVQGSVPEGFAERTMIGSFVESGEKAARYILMRLRGIWPLV